MSIRFGVFLIIFFSSFSECFCPLAYPSTRRADLRLEVNVPVNELDDFKLKVLSFAGQEGYSIRDTDVKTLPDGKYALFLQLLKGGDVLIILSNVFKEDRVLIGVHNFKNYPEYERDIQKLEDIIREKWQSVRPYAEPY